MKSARYLLLVAGAVLAGTSTAADYIKGKALADIVSGNTVYIYEIDCHDGEPNKILYFHPDGKIHARLRSCNIAAEHADDTKGRWKLSGGRFCLHELGKGDECYDVVRVSENTYKWVDLTGVRSAWELGTVKKGNPEDL